MIRDRGYLVFNPDYRGSGESEGHHELAKGEVDDVICAIDYLKSRGLVEDDRIGMYGQSHGAAISMLAAERDGRIKAVVEEAGFCDAVGLYENVAHSSDAGLRQLLNDALPMIGGTPQEVPQEYAVRSAINYVDSITAPILLIHGEKDPLIPAEQAYRMYDALKARGKTTELKIYPQEAHCVNDPVGRMEVWQLMFEWFERYV
jgi:dipeptidyl aminopeptidase/acylaminoacyl peptidase